jgi:hypothetical protein
VDDDYRLIKLISLIGWAHHGENKVGLRYFADGDHQRLTEDEQTAGHMMMAHYSGAVQYHRGDREFNIELDRRNLPDFSLVFVTNLSDEAVVLLGEMVARSLGASNHINPRVLGQRWVDDVIATCWRVQLAGYEDRFGERE